MKHELRLRYYYLIPWTMHDFTGSPPFPRHSQMMVQSPYYRTPFSHSLSHNPPQSHPRLHPPPSTTAYPGVVGSVAWHLYREEEEVGLSLGISRPHLTHPIRAPSRRSSEQNLTHWRAFQREEPTPATGRARFSLKYFILREFGCERF